MGESRGQRSRWRIAINVFLIAVSILVILKNAKLLAGLMRESPDHDKPHLLLPTNTNSSSPYIATAVLVEIHCQSAFSATLHAAINNLGPEVLIMVVHSPHNEIFVRGVLNSSPTLTQLHESNRLTLRRIDPADYTLPCPDKPNNICGQYSGKFWYSRLFTNSSFWSSFETPYVLTLQSDTLLCRPFPMQEFVQQGASFVGGVSGRMGEEYIEYTPLPNPRQNTKLDHGEYLNGGLSFRNVEWVKDCIEMYGNRPDGWIEDMLYQYCAIKINSTVHASEVAAYTFSSDNGHTLCFTFEGERICPLGVHKPWRARFNKQPQELYMELTRSCPGLGGLEKLHGQGNHNGEMCRIQDLNHSKAIEFRCNCTKQ